MELKNYIGGGFERVYIRGVHDVVWFGFESKNHSNRKIKRHAVWFGSVDF